MLTITDGSTAVSQTEVSRIIEATSLANVRVDEVNAGPVKATPDSIHAGIVNREIAFSPVPDSDALLVRAEHTLSCRNGDDAEIASITVAHIATFRLTADLDTTRAAVSAWIDTNVYFLIYPYVRQFFTEMTMTLGLPPVVLDYLRRDLQPLPDETTSQSSEPVK